MLMERECNKDQNASISTFSSKKHCALLHSPYNTTQFIKYSGSLSNAILQLIMNRIKSQCCAIDTIVTYIWYAIGFEHFLLTVLKVYTVHVQMYIHILFDDLIKLFSNWLENSRTKSSLWQFNFENFQVEKRHMNHVYPLTGNFLYSYSMHSKKSLNRQFFLHSKYESVISIWTISIYASCSTKS